jgi:hypothetical protein
VPKEPRADVSHAVFRFDAPTPTPDVMKLIPNAKSLAVQYTKPYFTPETLEAVIVAGTSLEYVEVIGTGLTYLEIRALRDKFPAMKIGHVPVYQP